MNLDHHDDTSAVVGGVPFAVTVPTAGKGSAGRRAPGDAAGPGRTVREPGVAAGIGLTDPREGTVIDCDTVGAPK
jgi:hypothetical protein